MDREEERRRFIGALWQRFEELQAWAIANWPDQEHPLSSADFVAARKEILGLRAPLPVPAPAALEPEQGGPQYIDQNPAPWP